MPLLGHYVPLAVLVASAAALYLINLFVYRYIYDDPNNQRAVWKKGLFLAIGLIPVSGIIILALSAVATILVFVAVIARLILGAVAHRSTPT